MQYTSLLRLPNNLDESPIQDTSRSWIDAFILLHLGWAFLVKLCQERVQTSMMALFTVRSTVGVWRE